MMIWRRVEVLFDIDGCAMVRLPVDFVVLLRRRLRGGIDARALAKAAGSVYPGSHMLFIRSMPRMDLTESLIGFLALKYWASSKEILVEIRDVPPFKAKGWKVKLCWEKDQNAEMVHV